MSFWGFAAAQPGVVLFCVLFIAVALVRIVYHIRNPNSASSHLIQLKAEMEPDKDEDVKEEE